MIELFKNWYIRHKIIGWIVLLLITFFVIRLFGFPPAPWLVLLHSIFQFQNLWLLLGYRLIIPLVGVLFLSLILFLSYILISIAAFLMSLWITSDSIQNNKSITSNLFDDPVPSLRFDKTTQILKHPFLEPIENTQSQMKSNRHDQSATQQSQMKSNRHDQSATQQSQISSNQRDQLTNQQSQPLSNRRNQSTDQQNKMLSNQWGQPATQILSNQPVNQQKELSAIQQTQAAPLQQALDNTSDTTQQMHKLQTDAVVQKDSDLYFWVDQATDSYKFDMIAPPQFLVFDALSDSGIRRKQKPNEDSVFALIGVRSEAIHPQQFGLFIVADGMGGQARGQDASHIAIEQIATSILSRLLTGSDNSDNFYAQLLVDGIQIANQMIQKENIENQQDMGCTVTAALIINNTAYIANIGDSRAYLFNWKEGLIQITTDHSVVAELVSAGKIQPDDVYTHPQRNKITRCLGDHSPVDIDIFAAPILPSDALLLCSDGLWEMIKDPEIESILTKSMAQPNYAAESLIQKANDAGGVDNISAIVIYSPKRRST